MPVNIDAAAEHYRAMLEVLGIAGDEKTPLRYVRALVELTGGGTPEQHLSVQFNEIGNNPQLITVTGIPFTSICKHHMLPFWGTANIGYLPKPGGHIVGLSKLPRALNELAHQPQLQEQLGDQLVDAIMTSIDAAGAAVTIRATHTCMALRGATTGPTTYMVTTTRRGELLESPYREEFSALTT